MPSRRLRFTAAASRQVLAWFHNDDKSFAANLQGLLDLARSRMGAPEWARSFVLFSASYAHFSFKTKVGGREVVPGKGPKPGQHNYALLNRIGENMTRTAGATFLDVTTMLERRPDGHMPHDCGHWCLPGPYDIGALLLFNALMGHIDAPLSQVQSPPRLSQVQSPPRRARPGAPRLWRPNLQLLRRGRQPAHREVVREPRRPVNASSAMSPRTTGRG